MKRKLKNMRLITSYLSILFLLPITNATDLLTGQYNIQRTNAVTSETALIQANVASGRFGPIGQWAIDGFSYAQPLLVDGGCGVPKALVIVTMHNSVDCFNALIPGTSPIWSINTGTSMTVYPGNTGFTYGGEIGCWATPVIDKSAGVIYTTCVTASGIWKLYSFNLLDGSTFSPPVIVSGTSKGLTFDSTRHIQRTDLLLSGGTIYIAFAGFSDQTPYQGWVMAYNSSTLDQSGVWCAVNSLNGQAGIWQGNGGLSADSSGNVYFISGNGSWDGSVNFGESFLKLTADLSSVLSFSTPANWATLNASDIDLGSGRMILAASFAMGGGKDGRWWLLNQSDLGGLQSSGSGPIQEWNALTVSGSGGAATGIYGGESFANNVLFLSGVADKIYSFSFNGATFSQTAIASTSSVFAFPGATIAYSSNGAISNSAIVWAETVSSNSSHSPQQGTLLALNAQTLAVLGSWSTGTYAKFSAPSVNDGRVYISTFDNNVKVFGLLKSGGLNGVTSITGSIN